MSKETNADILLRKNEVCNDILKETIDFTNGLLSLNYSLFESTEEKLVLMNNVACGFYFIMLNSISAITGMKIKEVYKISSLDQKIEDWSNEQRND